MHLTMIYRGYPIQIPLKWTRGKNLCFKPLDQKTLLDNHQSMGHPDENGPSFSVLRPEIEGNRQTRIKRNSQHHRVAPSFSFPQMFLPDLISLYFSRFLISHLFFFFLSSSSFISLKLTVHFDFATLESVYDVHLIYMSPQSRKTMQVHR